MILLPAGLGWMRAMAAPAEAASWAIVGVTNTGAIGSGNVTLTEPAGAAAGDLLVAMIGYRDSAPFTLPSGWALVAAQQSSGDLNTTDGVGSAVMAYIVRGASAPDLTFTRSGGNIAIGALGAYRGNHASPYDTGSANTLAVSSFTATTGGITTSGSNELIVAMLGMADAGGAGASAFDATDPGAASGAVDTTTAPAVGAWTMRHTSHSTVGADGGVAFADAVRATAGATGTIQSTYSLTGRHAMVAAAFKPAQGAAPAANTDPFDTDTLSQYVAYQDAGSDWSISGGKLQGGTASQSILARGGVSFADGEVSCVITHANDAGLALRLQDVNNYYLLVIKDESSTSGSGAGTVVIYKRIAGTYTQIGVSAGIAFTRGTAHTVTFRAVGTLLEADFDGVNKLSVTDSSITAAGLCGPRGNGSGNNTYDSLTWPDVHRYWRVHITANDGNTSFIGFTEIELRAAPAGADQTKSQSTFGAASASSAINTDNRASNVVDGSTVDGWLSSTGTFPQWWQYDCGNAGHTGGGAPNAPTIAVKQIAITGSWNAPDASPKDFTLQWSDNGSDWTTALTVAGQAGWTGASDVRVFSLPVLGGVYWNPGAKAAELTLSAADATATRSTTSNGGWRSVRGLTSHSTGKWYAEVANDANGSSNGSMMFGVGNASANTNSYPGSSDDNSCGIQANNMTNLSTYRNGSQTAQGNGTNAIGVGGRAMVAYDAATGKVWLGSNGVWFGGGDPATGTAPAYTFTAGTALFLMLGEQWAPQQCTLKNNAGENAYAIPAGFAMWG